MLRCVKCVCFILLMAVYMSADCASAGAFMQNKGQGQAILSTVIMEARHSFDKSGAVIPAAKTRKTEPSIFMDYGLQDWISVFAQGSYVNNQVGAPVNATYSGLGYLEFGSRIRILEAGSFILSAQSSIRLPGPSDHQNPAQIGNTGLETDNRLLAGKSFELGGLPAFSDLSIGYRTRAGLPANEWRSDITFGIKLLPQFMLLVQSFNAVSDGKGRFGFPNSSSSKLQLSAVYDFGQKWSGQLGGYTTIIGRNYNRETGAIIALWRKF